jgi:thioesterase domain-containing protein
VERVTEAFLSEPGLRPYLASAVLHEKARRLTRGALRHAGRSVDLHGVAADIHLIESEGSVTELLAEDGAQIVSHSAWAGATTGRFAIYPGHGEHNQMLWHPHLERNAALIRAIVASTPMATGPGATAC